MTNLRPNRRGAILAAAIWLAIGAILLMMGRLPICAYGTVKLWWGWSSRLRTASTSPIGTASAM